VIRIAIVDDHELVREGYRGSLCADPEFAVTAEGRHGEEAIQIVRRDKPDVLLLDVSMPGGMSGIEALTRIQQMHSNTKVVMVTQHEDMAMLDRLLALGAHGYVGKSAGLNELKKAIRKAHTGGRYVSNELAQERSLQMPSERGRSPFDSLSKRELEVVMSMVRGERALELAKRMNLSPKTISSHKMSMMRKIGANTDADVVKLAIAHGIAPQHAPPVINDLRH
jgi:two-component system, NarL family, invasion response regulator UvrY